MRKEQKLTKYINYAFFQSEGQMTSVFAAWMTISSIWRRDRVEELSHHTAQGNRSAPKHKGTHTLAASDPHTATV